MRKVFPLLLLILATNFVVAQKINMDSLIKVALINSANVKFEQVSNQDSLFKVLTLSKSPSQRVKLTYKIIGYGDHGTNDLAYLNKIYKWSLQNQDDVLTAAISSELAFNASRNGDDAEGLKMGLAAFKLASKTGDDQAIGITADNLGIVYKNNKAAKYYYNLGLKYSLRAKDDVFTYFNLTNLSDAYFAEHKADSADYFWKKSFEFSVTHKLSGGVLSGLVYLSANSKNQQSALKYGKIAVKMAQASGKPEFIRQASTNLAYVFYQYHRLDSALYYEKIAYSASANLSFSTKSVCAFGLMSIYKKLKRIDSALKYTEIYYKLRLKLIDIEKIQKANLLALTEQRRQQQAATTAFENKSKQQKTILIAILTGLVLLGVFSFFLIINNRQKHAANKLLQQQQAELKATQAQLIQSEKMASLGELTAGIAHEIQNPLNFVNNFSEVNTELIDEMQEEMDKGDYDEAKAIANDIKENQQKISQHGKRADFIVKGMLQHSRTSSGERQLSDINRLADEFLKLSYHGLRAKDKNFNAELITNLDENLPRINIVQQDIGRVLLNLFNNAFYAVNEKKKTAGDDYKPEISVTTSTQNNQIIISIKDNGMGIPAAIKDKIMQPFFTTKPTGEGTGLGLSLSYDIIVKGHGGKIDIAGKEGEGSAFTIQLPAT